MNRILLVDKPLGPTSFDVVRLVKRTLGMRRVGHAGTLDPLATGLLVVCTGTCTRLVPYLMNTKKKYLATVKLGMSTTTDDAEGESVKSMPVPVLKEASIVQALEVHTGNVKQVPPMFSAIKKDGEALYKKARRGEKLTLQERDVEIFGISLLGFSKDELSLEVSCGKGTYIRSLARDIAETLGTVGHLTALRRTFTSGFSVEKAVQFDSVSKMWEDGSLEPAMLHARDVMSGFLQVDLTPSDEAMVKDGRPIEAHRYSMATNEGETVCLIDSAGKLLAIAKTTADGFYKMVRVFPG